MAAEKSLTFSLSLEDEEEFAPANEKPSGSRREPVPLPRLQDASSQPFELDMADLGWPSISRADGASGAGIAPRNPRAIQEVSVPSQSEPMLTLELPSELSRSNGALPLLEAEIGSDGERVTSTSSVHNRSRARTAPELRLSISGAAEDAPLDLSELELERPTPAHPTSIPTLDEASAKLMGLLPRLLGGVAAGLSQARSTVVEKAQTLLSVTMVGRGQTKAHVSVRSGPSLGGRLRKLANSIGPWILTVILAVAVSTLVGRAFDAEGRFVLFGGPIPELGTVDEAAAAPSPTSPGKAQEPGATAPSPTAPLVETAALPPGIGYPGKGLLEVVTTEDELIYADGVFMGRGPLRRLPVSPGEHVVTIRTGPTERTLTIQVERGKSTRVAFLEAPAP